MNCWNQICGILYEPFFILMKDFEVICGKFNVIKLCASQIYAYKWITELYNY